MIDTLVVLTPEGTIGSVNKATLELLGYDEKEVIGQPASLLFSDTAKEEILFKGTGLERLIKEGAIRDYDIKYLTQRGEVIPVSFSGSVMHDKEGKVGGIICIARDMREMKRLMEKEKELAAAAADSKRAAELAKAKEQLLQAQKMESVGRLAGGVAHDFNNMLGVILDYSELALGETDPVSKLGTYLEEILGAAKRSVDITRQLLAFSRQQAIAPKPLDLNQAMAGMLKMLRHLIGEDIDLAWYPGTHLWPVFMDPSQLDQILVNLCVNARDAITGVGKISIETDSVNFDDSYCAVHPYFKPGDFVMIAVSDDGHGIDKKTREHMFEPFFTTKEMGKGTGLGLATVYGIVKQNNGFINIYSETEQGSTFKIYLPRHETAVKQVPKKDPVQSDVRGNETILLLEDEQTILNMTKIMLERIGYTVLAANRPADAISMAREYAEQIHLLITDVVMPDMNGREVSAKFHEIYPAVKSLFMSGYTANNIAHRGVLYEDVNFIQKLFSKKDLAVKVREILDGNKV